MEQMETRQMSESFRLGAVLALAGGFLDAYTYLVRGGVFANAQTGNMVLLGIRAAEGRWAEAASYLAPIGAFALGVLVAEAVKLLHRQLLPSQESHTIFLLAIMLLSYALPSQLSGNGYLSVPRESGKRAMPYRRLQKAAGHEGRHSADCLLL